MSRLGLISIAEAHEAPITGAVHMVRLKGVAGHAQPVIFFTTLLHWTIGGALKTEIAATTTPMQLEITSSYVTENRILFPADDGPFRPVADRSFTAAP